MRPAALRGARRRFAAAATTGAAAARAPVPPPSAPPAAAYVHLPFCVRKCRYCDFPVHALGPEAAPIGGREAPAIVNEYVSTLLKEVRATAPVAGAPPLATIFFGGGTPSLVPPADVGRIVGELKDRFGLADGAEVSLEADPGTFDAAKLAAYMAAGVNRFSIGVQSFDDAALAAAGRSHTAADARAALAAVRAVGAPSWSLDLICGLPEVSDDTWSATLDEAIAAGPHGVSVYDLTLEPGTPFARAAAAGALALPDDDAGAAMLATAGEKLAAAGLARVEVSSWARPGAACRHNAVYWRGDADYHAFGVGAASRLRGARVTRPRGLAAWRAWVSALSHPAAEAGAAAAVAARGVGVPGGAAATPDGPDDVLLEVVMLRLRTAAGLDVDWVAANHSAAAANAVTGALDAAARGGLAVRRAPPPGGSRPVFALTDPRGFMVSNGVISDVFLALDGIEAEG